MIIILAADPRRSHRLVVICPDIGRFLPIVVIIPLRVQDHILQRSKRGAILIEISASVCPGVPSSKQSALLREHISGKNYAFSIIESAVGSEPFQLARSAIGIKTDRHILGREITSEFCGSRHFRICIAGIERNLGRPITAHQVRVASKEDALRVLRIRIVRPGTISIHAEDRFQPLALPKHCICVGNVSHIKAAEIQGFKSEAAIEHLLHSLDLRCIEMTQIQRGQFIASGEHSTHIRNTGSIQVA